MRKYFLLALMLFPFWMASAQGLREVSGRIVDEDGMPLQGAIITAENCDKQCVSGADGSFSLSVPYTCRNLKGSFKDYVTATAEIDGSFIIFQLKYDAAGVKARAEAQEKARQDSIKLALAAQEQAQKEAAAAAKAALAAEAALLAAQKAEEEAQAKALAKAEKERLAAQEQARKEAEARAKAEADAKAKAQAKAERKAKDDEYDTHFKNKGLAHSVDVSYGYTIKTGTIVYESSGTKKYGCLSPMQLTYTLSYKFNRWVSLGVGAGVLYNLKSIDIVNDAFYDNPDFTEKRLDVPVFANLKLYFLRSGVRPFISASGGYYCLSGIVLWDAGIGCEFRLGKASSIQVLAMAAGMPWPDFSLKPAQYVSALAPGLKVGFNF